MWKDILKAYTDDQIIGAYLELQKAIDVWANLNNYDVKSKDDDSASEYSLAERLHNIKVASFPLLFTPNQFDLYKQFSKIEDITNGHAGVQRPLWELYNMLEWRDDNA